MVRHKKSKPHRKSTAHESSAKANQKRNVWMYATFLTAILLVVVAYQTYYVNGSVVSKTEKFLKSVFSQRGVNYTVKSTSVQKVYKITGEVQGQDVELYVTSDGKYLLQAVAQIPDTIEQNQQQDSGIPKSDKPEVQLYVMSYCPYGLQMEKATLPVVDLLGNTSDFQIHYVIYNQGRECTTINGTQYCSLHGNYELEEDVRQHCIDTLYGKETYYKYLRDFAFNCSYENRTCWEGVVANLSLDKSKIDQCVQDEMKTGEWLSSEAALNQKYSVRGSPTVIINGKQESVSRSPDAVKSAVCSAYTNPPAECNQTLSAEQTSPGFGAKTGSDASAAASCG